MFKDWTKETNQELAQKTILASQDLSLNNPRDALIREFVTKLPKIKKEKAQQALPPAKKKTASHSTQEKSHDLSHIKSLDDLKKELENFDDCFLKKTATNLVFSDGNPQAKIMLIGEAPGADEDRLGLPFVGLSGKLLDRMISSIGLNRQNTYITNCVPWRPPGNRQPSTQELAQCYPFLLKHIELVAPQILILVGGVATKNILQTNDGMMTLRQKWFEEIPNLKQNIFTMPFFHPAYLLRSPGQKKQAWLDLLKLRKKMTDLGIDNAKL